MISLSVIVCSIVQLASSASCPQSIPTVSVVPRCPSNEIEWISAAGKKNCSALEKYQNCSKDRSFVYHCVLNKNATELMEVCAPIWYMSGFCALFSMTDRRIINDPVLDCTKFVPPCPTRFPSNESFKYQMCYSHIKIPTAPQNEKEEHTTFVMTVIMAVLVIIVILVISLLICIRINWKKNNNSRKPRCEKIAENVDELDELIIEKKDDSKEIDKISPVDVTTRKDVEEEVTNFETMSGKNILCSLKNVVTIRDLREKLSEKESVPLKCLLVVDKENGVLYQDATVFEPCKKERYTLMVGNKNRTQGFKEDGNVHTDVISNKQISHGKCQMCCGHFTVPETLFDWVKDKLPGSGDVELQCPRCSDVWEEEELVEKCNMSEDEKLFLNCVLEVNEKTKKMKQ
uniref:Uncharacterized protein LOC111102923 n=1 Tax=Crassostrea virginica TaxID=6565 RepID=A0A8B8AK73_CRAVI|nr:uncharacterized protein LOC111102923 [Crassostrea virginica]XP_022291578.1 uncharacterized protein LOC111102923 [Crassostrea virginica]XP_022291579.1 uncharacterized protein LOC111102923 [Crassostrea virginica]XP_022291580.1 uncharacterized protein LOC111102923 [Crassostrea virginica]